MVMPLYDDNPFKLPHRPVMTWILIASNLFVFLIELSSGDPDSLVAGFGLTPSFLIHEVNIPGGPSPILTLGSYMFLHADWMHILGNMIFLWVFGDDIEECLGHGRFLVFYLACGIIGGLFFTFSNWQGEGPLIGASGAISGIVIAYVMLRPCAKVTTLLFGIPMRISAFWVIGVFVFIQLINLSAASHSEVAYWCHVGGMVGGAVLFPLMRPAGVKLFECIRPSATPVAPPTPIPLPPPRVPTVPTIPRGGSPS